MHSQIHFVALSGLFGGGPCCGKIVFEPPRDKADGSGLRRVDRIQKNNEPFAFSREASQNWAPLLDCLVVQAFFQNQINYGLLPPVGAATMVLLEKI